MFCNNCGEKLDEGTRFCTKCGTQQTVSAPASEQVLKEGTFCIGKNSQLTDKAGRLLLYKDRLEWNSELKKHVFPFDKITSVECSPERFVRHIFRVVYPFRITMVDDATEYMFHKDWLDKEKEENESWVAAINSARNGSF